MKHHPLNRPIWNSLITGHKRFAVGGKTARRFLDTVSPFAGVPDESPESLAALADLVPMGEQVMMIQLDPIPCPPSCEVMLSATGVQMAFTGFKRPETQRFEIEPLTPADVDEMVALAELTKPGPFLSRTHELGNFMGVRKDGKLIAMAGERLKHEQHTEVSGVCTHPDHQGQGLARELSVAATKAILDRGETPYLHAFADNSAAIGLYESIGFRIRTRLHVAAIGKRDVNA